MDATSTENRSTTTQPRLRRELPRRRARLRVGLVRDLLEVEGCSAEVFEATRHAAQLFEDLGADVGEVDLPSAKHGLSAYYIIGRPRRPRTLRASTRSAMATALTTRPTCSTCTCARAPRIRSGEHPADHAGTYALSAGYYDAYYGSAQKARTLIKRDFQRAFESFDVLITPTSPTAAFKLGEKASDPLAMYLSTSTRFPRTSRACRP